VKITDENLINHLQKKNVNALDYLVDIYSNLLYKIIYNVLSAYGEKGFIEECLNDVLLSIWNNINMFSGNQKKFINWICAIAKYKAIDYQRKLLKDKDTINIEDCIIISDSITESKVFSDESRSQLLEHINELEEMDRKIFIMRYFLDESINEIANKLGVSRNVIDTRLSRGRKTLKQKIESFEMEEHQNVEYI